MNNLYVVEILMPGCGCWFQGNCPYPLDKANEVMEQLQARHPYHTYRIRKEGEIIIDDVSLQPSFFSNFWQFLRVIFS